jgi:hypothetical protein
MNEAFKCCVFYFYFRPFPHGSPRAAEPPTSAEEKETVGRQIRALLEEGPHTAKEISSAIR